MLKPAFVFSFTCSRARRRLMAAGLFVALSAAAQQPGMPRAEKHEFKHEIDQLEEKLA